MIIAERSVISDRSEQPGLRAGGLHDRVHKRSSGGFCVCSGDRDELQCVCGMPQEICCCDCQRFSRLSNLNPDDARWKLRGSRCFARNGNRPPFDGILNERISVRFGPVQSEKECASLHLPRIASHLANSQATCSRRQAYVCALKHFNKFLSNFPRVVLGGALSLAVSLFRGGILYLFFWAQSNSHPHALLSATALQSLVPVSRTAP